MVAFKCVIDKINVSDVVILLCSCRLVDRSTTTLFHMLMCALATAAIKDGGRFYDLLLLLLLLRVAFERRQREFVVVVNE